jgi:signal transduction histidine kinase/ActR/RegA family two-component response regulator
MNRPAAAKGIFSPMAPHFFPGRIVILVALSAVLVIALGVFASRALETLNEGTDWIVHAQRARYELSRVLQILVDLGSGLRRFELTRDERSFSEAESAAAALPAELAALEKIVAEHPAQRGLFEQLSAVAEQRRRQTRELIDMTRAGNFDGAHAIIARGDTLKSLETARALVAQMEAEEARVSEEHRSVAARARYTVAFAIVGTTALAVVLLVLVAYVTLRHNERMRRVEHEARRALMESEAALREADHRKDDFLAMLSHELRNPLAPIRNAARLLEAPSLTAEELQRSRSIISRQVRHMASLLDDLLDVSRITRGVLTLKKEIVDLKSLFEAAVETARPFIDAKRHRLTVEWPQEPVLLEVDSVRLTQTLTNLLTNAAKYTDPEGAIVLGFRREPPSLLIYVRDTGIGIAAPMLIKVFEMFSQVAPQREHSDSGLGIGLALVRGLVELHGGRVEARSAGLGQGSEFLLHLPESLLRSASQVSGIPQAQTISAASRPLRIVIADDNRDSAETLGMLLELSGHEVFLSHTGVDALALAADKTPHVALLDIGMPGLDGYAVAERIRAQPWGASTVLIAITGWGQEDNKRRARDAGFNHHLTKPMDAAVLESILAAVPRES